MRQHQCISFYDTVAQETTVNNSATALPFNETEAVTTATVPKKKPWYAWIVTAAIIAVSTQG
ncbi:hypothetical protein SAMN05443667_101249 [Flavobacterium gillisiae]|uniref:Uncharacterized protein n=1 Tax=Flavobacterium gillisiae TaxID=150146 RepID=A0A1H3WUI5_9FLAO|nr:hypothetical protein [Flavobacterium gillisiae]SDZ90815.1 hypothetical protein SAMN05443667_101249 [Flavobacterium gillisiae]